MRQFLITIFVILLTGCGESTQTEQGSTTSKGKKIDCQAVEKWLGIDPPALVRTFFGFTDDSTWSKLQDGEVIVTIKTSISKGEFIRDDVQMVPYIKSGNTFTPKDTSWYYDVVRPQEGTDTSGDLEMECFATMIVSKTEQFK